MSVTLMELLTEKLSRYKTAILVYFGDFCELSDKKYTTVVSSFFLPVFPFIELSLEKRIFMSLNINFTRKKTI